MNVEAWKGAYDAFLADPGKWSWMLEWAREARCLPIYCDWTHGFGIDEHGAVLAKDFEEAGPPEGIVTDLRHLNVALHQGVKRHPWLRELLPARPAEAMTCPSCKGTGEIGPIQGTAVICVCGGAGWLPP